MQYSQQSEGGPSTQDLAGRGKKKITALLADKKMA